MEEGAEEDINYRNATLKDAILALEKKELIAEINEFAEKRNCVISICYPRDKDEAKEIHFILGIINSEIITSIGEKAEISAHIADSIEYDKVKVNFVTCDQTTFNELYEEDVTPFTPEKHNNIREFFRKHYTECYVGQSQDVTLQTKKQRSGSSSFFSENGGQQKDEVKLPTSEEVVQHLQKAPWWGVLKRCSPEKAGDVLDEACGRAKRTLSAEQTIDSRPTGAAK